MTNNSDTAKKHLISAFQDVEDGEDFLVAKASPSNSEEYLTEEERYVFEGY